MATKKTGPAYQDSFKVGRDLFHFTIKPAGETNFIVRQRNQRVMVGRLHRDGTISNVSANSGKLKVYTIDGILQHVAAHANEV